MNTLKLWSACLLTSALLLAASSSAWAQGFLIPTDRRLAALGLKHHRVQVKIQDRAAQTKVTQVFVNPTNRLLEATYIFPLPKAATISSFALYINGKKTKGQVLVRERARAIYQSIVRRMKDPGLIEHMGGQLFKARVYPIPRRGEQKIEIAFNQVVPYRSGIHRYVYPLKTARQTLRTIQDFTLSVDLRSRTPLKNIYSHTHKVSLSRKGDKRAVLGFEKSQALLNRNFVLYYSVSPKALGLNLLSHRKQGKDGYFLMMATPKVSYGSKELMGKNITFVLDTSGSMATNNRIKWAKQALSSCIKKLNPKDHFNIVRFSTDVESLYNGYKKATKSNVRQALAFVKRMEAAGGTAIDEAIKKALSFRPKGDGVNIVMMLTDGHPTIGETSPQVILQNVKKKNRFKARIYTFGIGTSINTKLLDKMAQSTGGAGEYVKPGKDIKERISWFYDKVRYPVLSNIKLKVSNGLRLRDLYPKRIPALFRGGQILVFGRYRGKGHAAITLTGKVNGKLRSYVFETQFPKASAKSDFIPRLWAHRKIAYLLDNIRLHGVRAELRNEVIRLAKKFNIVTPYTSYLVVEPRDRWRLGNTTRPPRTTTARPGGPLIQHGRRTRESSRRRGLNFGGGGLRSRQKAPNRIARRSRRARPAPRRVAGSAPRPVYRTPPSAQPRRAPSQDIDDDSLRRSSGKRAVRTARKLKQLKNKSVAGTQRYTKSRYVKGRLFRFSSGHWVDHKYRSNFKTLKVKYLSALYFKVLRLRPDLRPFFALGSHITVVIGNGRAVVVGNTETSTNDAKLRKFLKK